MRILIALAALTATPALAADCPTPVEEAAAEIDFVRLARIQLGRLFDLGRISNGLGLDAPPANTRERRDVKQGYVSTGARTDMGDDRCPPNASLPAPPSTEFN